MKQENRSEIIHDALNLLDDEMIEEVDKLRGGVVMDQQKELRPWRKWAALAASVSVVILAGYFFDGHFGEFTIPQSGNADQMNEESIHDIEGNLENDVESKEDIADDLTDSIPESDNLAGENADQEIYDEDTETEVEDTEIESTEMEE